MSLMQMSLYGAVLTLAVIAIRAVAINRLPKRTFIVLWCVVLVRLLIPFEIPCEFSVYSVLGDSAKEDGVEKDSVVRVSLTGTRETENRQNAVEDRQSAVAEYGQPESDLLSSNAALSEAEISDETNVVNKVDTVVWFVIWGIGAALCALYFVITYIRCHIEFGMSLPVQNAFVEQWLELRRAAQENVTVRNRGANKPCKLYNALHLFHYPAMDRISVRVSDRINTPLTYGVSRPVILLPKQTAWEKTEQLEYILWHEYTHIRYGDNVLKIIMVAALCLHWFNPFVWAVYFLLNRDIELACDESVIRRCGVDYKATYANMLIGMEAKRSGLMPLCNNFSQNAIEERVRAIMKIKKISIGAVIFAAGLVVGVTTAFATSAAGSAVGSTEKENDRHTDTQQRNNDLTDVSDRGSNRESTGEQNFPKLTEKVNISDKADITADQHIDLTQEEYDKLSALYLDGYENMTVSEFQDRIWRLTDTVEYIELLDRYFQEEALPEVWDHSEAWENLTAQSHDDMAFYLHFALKPLISGWWQERDFGGYVSVGEQNPSENAVQDMATFEYVTILTILDADELTVGEYINARLEVNEGIQDIFAAGYSAEELVDEEYMLTEIDSAVNTLTQRIGNDKLQVNVSYAFQPTDALKIYMSEEDFYEKYRKERQEELEKVIKPYMSFGLTCDYDARTDEGKMYFEGREVRGIIDEEQGIWITEHSGIGEGIYAEDAIEVYAVYEDGELTGLRAATAKEQEEIDRRRRQSTNESKRVGLEEEELREFPAGTAEDYDLMLSLKKPNYQQMSLADFNAALLDWANKHEDSYDRIECDRIWDDCRVDLSKEDKEFVTHTVNLSGCENAMYVRSEYTGEAEEDVCLNGDLTKLPEGDEAAYALCDLYYQFSYHVSDKQKVTVGERDRCVGGMLKGIEDFWEQTDIDELLKMEKTDIIEKLNELAKKYSTQNITFTIMPEDQIGFERMDERSLMEELHGGAEAQKKNF